MKKEEVEKDLEPKEMKDDGFNEEIEATDDESDEEEVDEVEDSPDKV